MNSRAGDEVAGNRLINRVLEPLEWFYPSAKAIYMWRMGRTFNRYSLGPVLILQMGKVGSKSVQAGLEAESLNRPIYHVHFLSRERTTRTENQRRKFFRTDRHGYLMRPWLNQFLLQTFEKHRDDRTWKLITLTREPVGRNISAFFENLDVVPCETEGNFEISSDYYEIEPTIVTIDNTKLLEQLFLERAQHDSPLRFFDREIRDIFGIDVLGAGFPIEKGYGIYRSERVDLLVLKVESLAHCGGKALAEFLGIDEVRIISRNIGAEKAYASLYDAFKKNVVIDAEYADMLYESEYMRTFYSSTEMATARAKWLVNKDSRSA